MWTVIKFFFILLWCEVINSPPYQLNKTEQIFEYVVKASTVIYFFIFISKEDYFCLFS